MDRYNEMKKPQAPERFRSFYEATLKRIVIHEKGTILNVNLQLAQMFAYTPEVLIGKSALDLAAPESGSDCLLLMAAIRRRYSIE